MAAAFANSVDAAIEAAAAAKFGSARVSVVRQYVHGEHNIDHGVWFVLGIDRGDGWELLGRRRTKQELWQLIESRENWATCIFDKRAIQSGNGKKTS